MIGETIAHYRITAKIGEGGMGEVYRATDTKLDRDVALKILPQSFASDADRMARFEREAKVLASLNHPNIAQIYGVEHRALVMELVEGETLKGPLPLDTALDYASQIANALEAAHEKGIVHRDLKPANIKVTPQGVVKVLDFGLAAISQISPSDGSSPANSPTLTISPTMAGMILGTAAYMSPEQARGKVVDKRADIWAFGVVLYEVLTGDHLFKGDDLTETLASVVKEQPDLGKAPLEVHRLLRKCLEKDPRKRLRDIGDAWELLEAPPAPEQAASSRPWTGRIGWIAAAVLALALGALTGQRFLRPPVGQQVLRFAVPAPENTRFLGAPAISPDGRSLAFIAGTGDRFELWVRDLDSLSARPFAGTEGARNPFWSPNSRAIAFFAQGKLRRVDAAGGSVLTLCDGGPSPTGSWGSRDVILFSRSLSSGLFSVPAAGGNATTVTTPEKTTTHMFPWFLPDGRHFLYKSLQERLIYMADLGAGDGLKARREIQRLQGSAYSGTVYAPPGFLMFLRDRTLMALPFDLDNGQLAGDAVPLVEGLDLFSVSQNGVLAYAASGSLAGRGTQLTWFDRAGKADGTVGMPAGINWPAISPDGGRVVHDASDPRTVSVDVWVHDLARGTESRFTFGPDTSNFPVWSPDGRNIAFRRISQGKAELFQRAVDGAMEQLLDDSVPDRRADDWSRDGQYIIEEVTDPKTKQDIWVLPLTDGKPGKPFPFLQSPFNETHAKLSPNGKWLAYGSDETNRDEVYVQEFAVSPAGRSSAGGGKWQISTSGGSRPIWSRDGRELFFIGADQKMMTVDIKSGPKLDPGAPKTLFETRFGGSIDHWFDVGKDGRFLIPTRLAPATASEPMTVVVNWAAILKK